MSSRLNPFHARILERTLLTKPGSTKEVYHLELDLAGSGMRFNVGDSLGIYGDNDPLLVAQILEALKCDPATLIEHPRTGEPMTLERFLTKKANLARPTQAFLQALSLNPDVPLHDILDLLNTHRTFHLQQLVAAFSPLLPRFYSIASSQLVHPDVAHLTVAVSSHLHNGQIRYGVASHFLCHLAEVGTTPIPCYVQPAPHFTIPLEDHLPLIMVGPGTGVAPFRGFLQERLARNAPGKHWLFFGERHQNFDFFYEEYWKSLVQDEKLMLDVAFSRDQEQKVYVQHKLYEKGAEIWAWLQEGAYLYLCGEADPMAKDVEATLLRIFQEFGNLPDQELRPYLHQLRRERRFLADVY